MEQALVAEVSGFDYTPFRIKYDPILHPSISLFPTVL